MQTKHVISEARSSTNQILYITIILYQELYVVPVNVEYSYQQSNSRYATSWNNNTAGVTSCVITTKLFFFIIGWIFDILTFICKVHCFDSSVICISSMPNPGPMISTGRKPANEAHTLGCTSSLLSMMPSLPSQWAQLLPSCLHAGCIHCCICWKFDYFRYLTD